MLLRFAYMAMVASLCFAQHAGPSTEGALEKGIENFRKGEISEARRDFEKAVKLSPADARAITYLVITRADLGECTGQATDELRLQAHRNPDGDMRRLAGLALIRCLLPTGDLDEPLSLLGQLRNAFPNDPDVLYESVQVYNRAWSTAFQQLRQKAPASYRSDQMAGEVLEIQGHYAEAAAEYRKAIAKQPNALGLHYRLGRVLAQAANQPASLEVAQQAFEAELKLNPMNAAAEYQIGQTMMAAKNAAGAAEHFEKALEIAPTFVESIVALAKLKIDAQDYKDAIPLLEHAVELQPTLEAAHFNLMLAYRGAGKSKLADREQLQVDNLKRHLTDPPSTR